jgi:hypothetical protein
MKKKLLQSVAIVACMVTVGVLFGWRYLWTPQRVQRSSPESPRVAQSAAPLSSQNETSIQTAAHTPAQPAAAHGANMLKNTWFENRLESWDYWRDGKEHNASISTVDAMVSGKNTRALRIENPYKTLIGLQQLATVEAGGVYRLSGRARSVVTNDPKVLFGGRLSIWLPEKREPEIVWMSEYDQWWKKETIFTAAMEGAAVVLVHMGYGGVGSTGEFTDVALERIGP